MKILPSNDVTAALMATMDLSRVWVLVEGKSDLNALITFFDDDIVSFIAMKYGKGKREVIKIIIERNETQQMPSNYLGIVDSDFDKILGSSLDIANLFFSEGHDLDIDILGTGALIRFIDIHAEKEKLDKVTGSSDRKIASETILAYILKGAAEFGYVRLSCLKMGLSFEGIQLKKYCYSDFSVKVDDLINEIDLKHPSTDLRGLVSFEKQQHHDVNMISNGHDAFEVLTAMFSRFCKKMHKGSNAEKVRNLVHGCFGSSHFRETALCESIVTWEKDTNRAILSV